MPTVRDLLSQIWSLFRRAGIADDLVIIEHIAALLLDQSGIYLSSDLFSPRKPPPLLDLKSGEISDLISKAVKEVGDATTLFNHHVLFRLPEMLAGGRYPTPRHIVEFMLRVADVRKNHTLADFACGSGGFLVAGRRAAEVTGIEISIEWARFAWANARLHEMVDFRIESDNAFQMYRPDLSAADDYFDRVVLNPPFGEKIDARLAESLFNLKITSSETAFAMLALKQLAPDGRAAVLAPSGVLFRNSVAESELRKRLVDDHHLDAIVTLPKDSFQPYSPLQTHLILASKESNAAENQTWMIRAERDGYPAGRSRDLTRPPTEPSDLPFIERAIASSISAPDGSLLGIAKIGSDGSLLGVVIEAVPSAVLASVELLDPPAGAKKKSLSLLVSARGERGNTQTWRILLDSGDQKKVRDRDKLLSDLYGSAAKDMPAKLLFRCASPGQGVAVSSEGRIIGVKVPRSLIRQRDYELRPDEYIKAPEEEREHKAPAVLLGEILKDQREMFARIDGLLGRLELAPVADQKIPPPLLKDGKKEIKPFGVLSEKQMLIWEQVREKVAIVGQGKGAYKAAEYFSAADVEPAGEEISYETLFALDLFERMGVIVPVTFKDDDKGDQKARYRLATERDVWPLKSKEEGV
jgi:hypothetical protein